MVAGLLLLSFCYAKVARFLSNHSSNSAPDRTTDLSIFITTASIYSLQDIAAWLVKDIWS
jgi:hypothetical protein